jgi:predicted GIY-YIG superfamily endonuclease
MAEARRTPLDAPGTVYLIHFSGRTSENRQHYLGWSGDVNRRFAQHCAGKGSGETRKAVSEGLRLTLAQTWQGTPLLEQRLKAWSRTGHKGFRGLCPFCDGTATLPAQLKRDLGMPSLTRRQLTATG